MFNLMRKTFILSSIKSCYFLFTDVLINNYYKLLYILNDSFAIILTVLELVKNK